MERMGTFRVRIEIAALGENRFEQLEALVDTGSTYTCIPKDILGRLAIQPADRRPFELADGREVWYDTGRIQLRIGARAEPTIVVFADPGSEPILGAFTLEAFLLAADPARQRLVPVPGLLKATSDAHRREAGRRPPTASPPPRSSPPPPAPALGQQRLARR